MSEVRAFALTTRNMTLLIPVFLLIMLPLVVLRQFIPTGTEMTLAAIVWAAIVCFNAGGILWGLGRIFPPFQRYLLWTQKGKI
jgi:hypothetical protein